MSQIRDLKRTDELVWYDPVGQDRPVARRQSRSKVLCAVVGALAMAGCGGGGRGTTARQIPFDKLAAEQAKVLCEILWSCCDGTERTAMAQDWPAIAKSREGCEAFLGPTLGANDAEITPLVAAGRIIYHPEKAGACIDAFAASGAACRAFKPEDLRIAACNQLVEGTVADGGDCTEDDECIGGRCDTVHGPSHCVTLPGEGESCPTHDCRHPLGCLEGTCRPLGIEGEPCAGYSECATGACGSSGGGPMVCQRPPMCDGV